MFSVCVSVHTTVYPIQVQAGGYPIQVQMGGTPSQVWGGTPAGVPLQSASWGTPHRSTPLSASQGGYPGYSPTGVPLHPGQIPGWGGGTPYRSSIACTCYTAVGMPLAFTQEDFLVYKHRSTFQSRCRFLCHFITQKLGSKSESDSVQCDKFWTLQCHRLVKIVKIAVKTKVVPHEGP